MGRKGKSRILVKRKSEYFVEDSKILKTIEKYWTAGQVISRVRRERFLVKTVLKGKSNEIFFLIFSGISSSQAPYSVSEGFSN